MPALQNTKGRVVGYKDHKIYGDSSIYENTPGDNTKFFLELSWTSSIMPDPEALWRDVQKLDDLYEELLWHPDDELQFTHDGKRVIIINKTLEEQENV